MLCVTRYPWNTCVVPSSIATGIDTETAFLHSWSTLTRLSSIRNAVATFRSCARAMSKGFSRRCEAGASSVVTERLLFPVKRALFGPRGSIGRRPNAPVRLSLDRERDDVRDRGAAVRRVCDEADPVIPRRQHAALRIAAGDAVRVATGEHVAQPREQPARIAARCEELEVEPRQRDDVLRAVRARDLA